MQQIEQNSENLRSDMQLNNWYNQQSGFGFLMKRFLFLSHIISQFLVPVVAHTVDFSKPARTTCLQMTSNRYARGGLGKRIKWEIVGACDVEIDPSNKGFVNSLTVYPYQKDRSSFYLKRIEDGLHQRLKPYQNPSGRWVHCLWRTKNHLRAICAIKDWY